MLCCKIIVNKVTFKFKLENIHKNQQNDLINDNNNNNNNNNRVYTPLSERCSQSRVFTTYQIQITEKKYMLT